MLINSGQHIHTTMKEGHWPKFQNANSTVKQKHTSINGQQQQILHHNHHKEFTPRWAKNTQKGIHTEAKDYKAVNTKNIFSSMAMKTAIHLANYTRDKIH
ncbi:hypothetical protein Nepgr_031796 [Nepenthes gracilis]|uniref:Uncharacterized protein n=1 Tax=Nepenthes gracilis TaxID=150966 RepID=A0AAD3Y5F8_NEPGR|nr:hypothetical protein Nepgr_031796 [Nepenthes gracilis]